MKITLYLIAGSLVCDEGKKGKLIIANEMRERCEDGKWMLAIAHVHDAQHMHGKDTCRKVFALA